MNLEYEFSVVKFFIVHFEAPLQKDRPGLSQTGISCHRELRYLSARKKVE